MGEKVKPNVPASKNEKPRQLPTVSITKTRAVSVRHAYKYYGSKKLPNHVMSDLSMTVRKGTIYGLLGASGCGKTTLLTSIVGRRRMDSGEIWVLGGKPGTRSSGVPGKRIGYMPQEMALHEEFTIKETMMYFGWIFGMTTSEINARLQFLLNFLDLPNKNRLVKSLSGGQQRRVSFAAALVHDPELLVLDEPTVGMDPLLRYAIWDYLVEITKDGNRTVLLTTHYIEEARRAHTIGLMRNGKLLAEESPNDLLKMYGSQSLEEIFLLLSRQQGDAVGNQPDANINENITLASQTRDNKNTISATDESDETNGHIDISKEPNIFAKAFQSCTDCLNMTSTGKIKALMQKNTLRMVRNMGVLVFIFAVPVVQVSLFCLTIGRDPMGLKLAIVNHEQNYTNMWYQQCDFSSGCIFSNLSCRYLHYLSNETIEKIYYPDTNSAIAAVKNGEAWGTMYFTENFTAAFARRMDLGNTADPEILKQSDIRIWLDMSNQQIGYIIHRDLQLSYQAFAKDFLLSCGHNPELAEIPISFQEPLYGSSSLTFSDFVAPGVILTIVFFLAVGLTSLSLIIEKTEGLLDRSYVAGVTPCEILLCHVGTQFFVMFVQTALVLSSMMLGFGLKCEGDIGWILVLTILEGLCGMCFGFVISASCELERNAIQVALGSFYPVILLSGVVWPIEAMPAVLRFISTFCPLTLATTSLRSMFTRGWSLLDKDVYYGFISSIVWIVIFLIITSVVLRIKSV